jgi:hypothetical protein
LLSAFDPSEINNSYEQEPTSSKIMPTMHNLEDYLLPLNLCRMVSVRPSSEHLQPEPAPSDIHQSSIYATFSVPTGVCTRIFLIKHAYTHSEDLTAR